MRTSAAAPTPVGTANNSRLPTGRYASAPRMGAGLGNSGAQSNGNGLEPVYASNRSLTPNRFVSSYDRDEGVAANSNDPRTPSSTGLIRLSLKKPMGIVFEPMYDPNQKSVQRGVRICDLPRTGAAALSRKLQVGDELLQINDKTVSRLNFDQIMDFIIEADPECVNLLFRRPRKEILQARQGVQQKLNAAANKDNPSTVKWVDEGQEDNRKKSKEKAAVKVEKKDPKKISKRTKKSSVSEDEEETQQSSTVGDDSYAKPPPATTSRSRKKSKARRDPYETESFLDILIDTICANSNNVCRDAFRRNEDEYFSEDDESFVTDAEDESTYVTYDESVDARGKRNRKKPPVDEETEDDTRNDRDEEERRKHKPQRKDKSAEKPEPKQPEKKKYEDDGTLESLDSAERAKLQEPTTPTQQPPLGLAPTPPAPLEAKPLLTLPAPEPEEDVNPAPIREVEYDDRIDHGADVSVMESLGGPSLLIEKQRAAVMAAHMGVHGQRVVPSEIMEKYGLGYPVKFGMTRQQTIESDPLMFYTYVVKELLDEHEPEKVRLLDKLLAKYKGREDHLVQKLSVRYDRPLDQQTPTIPEEHDQVAFSDAVKKNISSSEAAAVVHTAKERMHIGEPIEEHVFEEHEWPEKETKEPEIGDDVIEEESSSGSEYSRDSVDGTSPAVIAQVSELLNYVYGKTSVPGQIDRVSTIMRAYEGREAVLLELLETKALIKANKEKENSDNLPSFLRNSQHHMAQAQRNAEDVEASELPPVTPMATQPVTDDMSSMSGVSSPAHEREASGIVSSTVSTASGFCPRFLSLSHSPSPFSVPFRRSRSHAHDTGFVG